MEEAFWYELSKENQHREDTSDIGLKQAGFSYLNRQPITITLVAPCHCSPWTGRKLISIESQRYWYCSLEYKGSQRGNHVSVSHVAHLTLFRVGWKFEEVGPSEGVSSKGLVGCHSSLSSLPHTISGHKVNVLLYSMFLPITCYHRPKVMTPRTVSSDNPFLLISCLPQLLDMVMERWLTPLVYRRSINY